MSDHAPPLCSVIIPIKGRIALLREAVDSLIGQKWCQWEAILVDDGSSRNDVEELRRIEKSDARIRLIVRDADPPGANHCRNIGLAAAKAPLVVFLDSDDCLSPDCLAARVRAMQENPELEFAAFPHRHFLNTPGDRDDVWPISADEDHLERLLMMYVPWQTAGPVWRVQALRRIGGWDDRLPSGQDWDLHLRALAMDLKYRVFSEPAFFHRLTHPGRVSISFQKTGPEHIAGQDLAYSNAATLLSERGLLTERRRRLLARLFLIVSESWMRSRRPGDAQRCWNSALQRGLISPRQHRQGLHLLKVWPMRLLRGAYRKYLSLQWPREMRHVLVA